MSEETIVTIATVVFIGTLFLGLPILILWLRDRYGFVGMGIRRVLGALALLFGVIIIAWVLYNLAFPTEAFRAHFRNPFQLLVPNRDAGGWLEVAPGTAEGG